MMTKIKIKLVTLGNLKYPVDFNKIEKWKSKIIEVEHVDEIQALPNAEGDHWSYPDNQLAQLVSLDNKYDFTICIINAPLQQNFYLRRLDDNICVLSLCETAEILRYANLTIENFIIRNLYELCAFYLEGRKKIQNSAYGLAHDETRSCLFDMNANKADIVFSTEHPILCDQCKARIMSSQVAKEFLPNMEKELRKIRKALYYRLTDFVKDHPVLSLIIASSSAVILNIIANALYDLLRR